MQSGGTGSSWMHQLRRWWPLGMIAVQCAAIGIAVSYSYYLSDDFLIFNRAQAYGLSGKLLGLNVYQHFGPVVRAMYWLVQHFTPGRYPLGETLIIAWIAALLVLTWAMCIVLRASQLATAVALWIVGSSIYILHVAEWFGEAMHITSAMTGTALTGVLFLMWARTGHRRWVFLSVAGYALALLTQERPILAFGYLFLFYYLVLLRTPLRRLPMQIARDWWIWIGYLCIAIAYLWLYFTHYYGAGGEPQAGVGLISRFLLLAIGRFFGGLFGLWVLPGGKHFVSGDPAAIAVVVVSLTMIFGLVAVTIWKRRSTGRVWLFLLIAIVVSMLMVAVGLAGLYGLEPADDLQYYGDLTVPLSWAAVSLISMLREGSTPPPHAEVAATSPENAVTARWPRVFLAAVAIGVVSLTVGSWVSLGQTDGRAGQQRKTWAYTVQKTIGEGRGPMPFAVVGDITPTFLTPSFLAPYNETSAVLSVLVPYRWSDDASPDVRAIDNKGVLQPVSGRVLTSMNLLSGSPKVVLHGAKREAQGVCISAGQSATFELPARVSSDSLVGIFDFTSRTDSEMLGVTLDGSTYTYDWSNTPFRAAQGRAMIWLQGTSAQYVALMARSGSACITSVTLVQPMYEDGTGTQCHEVAPDGSYGALGECAPSWPKKPD